MQFTEADDLIDIRYDNVFKACFNIEVVVFALLFTANHHTNSKLRNAHELAIIICILGGNSCCF